MKRLPSRTPTLSDVARLAGVGNGTASRVLNGGENCSPDAVRRVESAIRKLGFIPNRLARSLKGGKSGTIGMIVPSISDMFFSQCAEAVEAVARRNGSLLIVMASHDDEEIELSNLRLLLLHRIDGLILAPAKASPKLGKELKAMTIPAVGLDRPLHQPQLPSVMSENREGAIAATRHLLSHGYETVICIHVRPELHTIGERLAGYEEAMVEAGMAPILEMLETAADAERCLVKHRKRSKQRIAIFAANNLAARLTWEALRKLKLAVPREVGILCFDDFDLADSLSPPMSVVQQTIEGLGRRSAELLFRMMNENGAVGDKVSIEPIRLPTTLVIRQSCGCKAARSPRKLV